MTGQSLQPRALPSEVPPAHALSVRPSSLRTLARLLLAVVGSATGAVVVGVVVVAAWFTHRGAAAVTHLPLRAYADLRAARGFRTHRVELEAARVDLSHLGQHTHANWVLFELPFDPTTPGIKNVRFEPHALRETNVGAYPTQVGCVPVPTLGSVESRSWGEYTVNGAGGSRFLADHPLAPRFPARTFAINVPTRVANAAACWDPALQLPGSWRLEVSWDSPEMP